MEETIKAPTAIFTGKIGSEIYVNLTHEKGFTDDTRIDVTDQYHTELVTEITDNFARFNNTEKTLKITPNNSDETIYNVMITDADGQTHTVVVDMTEPDALITDDAKVTAFGDRIFEILFNEPVQNLTSVYDFAIDYANKAVIDRPVYIDHRLPENSEFASQAFANGNPLELYSCKINAIESFVVKKDADYYALNAEGKIINSSTPSTPITDAVPLRINKGITNAAVLVETHEFIYPSDPPAPGDPDNRAKTVGIVLYDTPFRPTPGLSSVFLNFYFRYFGSDDEGTLYEPEGKPIDWLGYFASNDIQTKVSDDARRIEFQFKGYSLPTGMHNLIINYAKTFPGYPGNLRIVDANENPFPIVSKDVETIKWAKKATLVNVKSISRTELEIEFDKPVLCLENELLINGEKPHMVERKGNGYTTLIAKLETKHALEVGPAIEVTIGSITDACGYKTAEKTVAIEVVPKAPKVINLIQKTGPNEVTTLIEVEFDDNMDSAIGDPSDYITIYEVDFVTEEDIKPALESTLNVDFTPFEPENEKFNLTVTDPMLFPGKKYRIYIKDFTNAVGTVMEKYDEVIFVSDLTEPHIVGILLTDDYDDYSSDATKEYRHRIVINYNEPMITNGVASVLDPTNYIITGPAMNPTLCDEPKIELAPNLLLEDISIKHHNTSVLIKVNADALRTLFETEELYKAYFFGKSTALHLVSPGYCALKEVKYVTNESKNVLNFACVKELPSIVSKIVVDPLNTNTNIEVKDETHLLVKFNSNLFNTTEKDPSLNQITAVDHSDFSIITGSLATPDTQVNASAAELTVIAPTTPGDPTQYEILLTFEPEVLIPDTFLVIGNEHSKDIFENPVTFDATPVSTGIVDRGLLNYAVINSYKGHEAIVKLAFSEDVTIKNLNGATSYIEDLANAAGCFAMKFEGSNWISFKNIVLENGEDVPDENYLTTPRKELYLLFNGHFTVFPNIKATIVTSVLQENMLILDNTPNHPIEIIPMDEAKEVYWEEPVSSGPVGIP